MSFTYTPAELEQLTDRVNQIADEQAERRAERAEAKVKELAIHSVLDATIIGYQRTIIGILTAALAVACAACAALLVSK